VSLPFANLNTQPNFTDSSSPPQIIRATATIFYRMTADTGIQEKDYVRQRLDPRVGDPVPDIGHDAPENDDQDHQPLRHFLDIAHADIDAGQQRLVGERVEIAAELGLQAVVLGEEAVERVRDAGRAELRQSSCQCRRRPEPRCAPRGRYRGS